MIVARIDTEQLVELLAPTLGHAKSQDAVAEAAKALKLNTAFVTAEEGVAVLLRLEDEPGLVGIVARLAKARFRLRHSQNRTMTRNEEK